MIDFYASQTAILKPKIDVDEYNQPVYGPEAEFKCRFEFKRRMVRNKDKQEVISEAFLMTSRAIKVDDLIIYDGAELIAITSEPQRGLFGEIMHYEVSL